MDRNLALPTTRAEVAVAGTITRLGYEGQMRHSRLMLQFTQELFGRPWRANSAPRSKNVQPVCCGRSPLDLPTSNINALR